MTLIIKHLVCLSRVFFAESDSVVTVEMKNKLHWGVFLLLSLFICRSYLIGKTEYNHIYVFNNHFVPFFHYCSITSNLLFCSLNITKASKQHTYVLSRSFLQQVHSSSNRLYLHFPTVWLGDLFTATE